MSNAGAGAASFVFIFLKAFQQRHVMHNDWYAIVPTSVAMAFVEVYVIATVATRGYGWGLVLSIGIGSGLGAVTAMYLHNIKLRWRERNAGR